MPLTVFTFHRVLPEIHPDAISCKLFEKQLEFLRKRFKIISPEDAETFISGNPASHLKDEKTPCAMLSFDDGWLDNWLYATPILKKHNIRAALALSAGFLHDGSIRLEEEAAIVERHNLDAERIAPSGDTQCYLRRNEVRAMHDSGCWAIQAHGTTHAKRASGISALADNSVPAFSEFLKNDLENCILEIKTITGNAPTMMFWPWGQYSSLSLKIAGTLGLKIQFTTRKGLIRFGDQRPVLPRVGVSSKWKKFQSNAKTFGSPWRTCLHGLVAHKERLRF